MKAKTESPFHFKQFSVQHHRSAMKVNTDGVLVGVLAPIEKGNTVLDIGTGAGYIALMAAQKCAASVTAIEVDEASAQEAQLNFNNSPWKEKMTLIHQPFQQYYHYHHSHYHHIVANPPFFTNHFPSSLQPKKQARHNDSLPFLELARGVKEVMTKSGNFTVILPPKEMTLLSKIAEEQQIYPLRNWNIIGKEGGEITRQVICFSFQRGTLQEDKTLTIRKSNNDFTQEYRDLTANYITIQSFHQD